MYFLMTNDVESFSIPHNRLDLDTAIEVYKVGLLRLLEAYAKYDFKCTFNFTGENNNIVSEAVELVLDHGHIIGCHGYISDFLADYLKTCIKIFIYQCCVHIPEYLKKVHHNKTKRLFKNATQKSPRVVLRVRAMRLPGSLIQARILSEGKYI